MPSHVQRGRLAAGIGHSPARQRGEHFAEGRAQVVYVYVWVYVCMRTRQYMYIYSCVYMCAYIALRGNGETTFKRQGAISMSTCMSLCIHTYAYIYIHVYMCVSSDCMFGCEAIYVWVYVSMYTCIYIYIYICMRSEQFRAWLRGYGHVEKTR